MPRSVQNKGLALISTMIGEPISIILAFSDIKRSSFYHWLDGRHSPLLEQKLAGVLAEHISEYSTITVPELRKLVGLEPRETKPQPQRTTP